MDEVCQVCRKAEKRNNDEIFRNSKGDVIGYSGLIFELLKEVQTEVYISNIGQFSLTKIRRNANL